MKIEGLSEVSQQGLALSDVSETCEWNVFFIIENLREIRDFASAEEICHFLLIGLIGIIANISFHCIFVYIPSLKHHKDNPKRTVINFSPLHRAMSSELYI